MSILVVLAMLLAGIFGVTCTQTWYRLRYVPGPLMPRLSILWLAWKLYTGTYVDSLVRLHEEYGPLVCIGPGWVSLSDPNEIMRIQHARSLWERSRAYNGFRSAPGVDSMSTTIDRQQHHELRSKLEPGYSGKGVLSQVHSQMDRHITDMVDVIKNNYIRGTGSDRRGQGRPLDLSKMIIYLLVDITSGLSFGRSFGCVKRQGDFHGYIETSETKLPLVLAIAVTPLWRMLMSCTYARYIMPSGGPLKPIISIAQSAAAEIFNNGDKALRRDTMLGSFVAHGLTQEQLELETVVQLLGGSETTSTAILNTVLQLLSTPAAYQRLQAEIDSAIDSGRIASSPAKDAEARALPYLQAVVREGLRLLPPAGLIPKEHGCRGTQPVCGMQVPGGVSVDLCIKSAVRDKGIFGDDSGSFRPERWLEADEPSLAIMEKTWRLVFGGPSRWECIGKGLALAEMNKVYIELFRHFDMAIANPAKPWTAQGGRIWVITDFMVNVSARSRHD